LLQNLSFYQFSTI